MHRMYPYSALHGKCAASPLSEHTTTGHFAIAVIISGTAFFGWVKATKTLHSQLHVIWQGLMSREGAQTKTSVSYNRRT